MPACIPGYIWWSEEGTRSLDFRLQLQVDSAFFKNLQTRILAQAVLELSFWEGLDSSVILKEALKEETCFAYVQCCAYMNTW